MGNSRKHFARLVGLTFALIGLSWPTPGQNNPPPNLKHKRGIIGWQKA